MNFDSTHTILLSILFIFSGPNLQANEEKKTLKDSAQIHEHIQKGKQLLSLNPDSSLIFFRKALNWSKNNQNTQQQAGIYQEIGTVYRMQSQYDSAQFFFSKALELFRSQKDSVGIAKAMNNLGTIHFFKGRFKEAVEYYHQSIDLFKAYDNIKGMADCKNNIGIIHWKQKNYELAKTYYKEAAKHYEDLGSKKMIGYIHNNLGVIYGETNHQQESLKYYQKAAGIFEELGLQQLVKSSYQNMGIVYKNLGEYKNSERYYNKALKIAQNLKDQNLQASIYINLSELYNVMADSVSTKPSERKTYLSKAVRNGEKAMQLARKINTIPLINSMSSSLMNIYENAGQLRKALDMARLYHETSDSLFSKEKTQAIEELEAKYQSEKKEIRIDKLENEKAFQDLRVKRQQALIYTFITGLILISIFLLIIYRQKQKKKRAYAMLQEKNKEVEQQKSSIQEQAEELRKLNATKNKFFSIIAHDLKNPFNTLIGNSELLLSKWEDNNKEQLKSYAQDIYTVSERGYNLLINLLEWARAQTGRLEIKPENLLLNDIIQQNIFLLTPNADAKKIRIVNEIPGEIFVYADPNTLTTTVRNLISNAIKYTHDGGWIKLSLHMNHDYVTLYIQDNGIGIDEHYQDELFRIDKSYTTEGTANEKGTGIGLLLCREFIRKNGGTLNFESEKGKGSTFYFTLPTGEPESLS